VRDSDDGPCNRCRTKGRSCGASTLPKDDTTRRIPKRASIGCQTEPQSADRLQASNSDMQCQTQLDQSAAPATGHFGDIPQLEGMGSLLNRGLSEGDVVYLESLDFPHFEAASMLFWDFEFGRTVKPVLE
jgi:hypothetical protein